MKTSDILKKLFTAFPNTQINAATVSVYIEILADIPKEDLSLIVNQCIGDCKFLPSIAEIRDRWHDMTRNPNQLTAVEAWEEVVEAFRKVGYMGRPEFSDARTTKIVKAMGWETLCASETQMADRAHFIKFFDALTQRDERNAKLLPASRELIERNRREIIPGSGIRFTLKEGDE